MHVLHKLFSVAREIQSTYTTSNNSSPSPCSPKREPVICEFGCRDGCVLWRQCCIAHSQFSSAADSYCCVQQKVSQRFWSGQELMLRENHRGFRNMIFRHMTYSSGSLFFAPAADSVKFLSCPPSFKKKKISLCFCVSLPHLSVALFLECTLILFPSPALPSLQSHWPILWRTVKDRRSVYRLASFLGHWDSID